MISTQSAGHKQLVELHLPSPQQYAFRRTADAGKELTPAIPGDLLQRVHEE
jgi:hypothetical protein